MSRALLCAIMLAVFLSALPFVSAELPSDVPIVDYVNDYAGVLSSDEITQLDSVLRAIDANGSVQIAIVTVHNLAGQDIEGFSYQVAEGHLGDPTKNNGLLLLVAVEDHKYRFEVGRGIEPYLNDARVGRIGRDILTPAFRNGVYGQGVYDAVLAAAAHVASGDVATDDAGVVFISDQFFATAFGSVVLFFMIFFFIAVILGAIGAAQKKSKRSDDKYFTAALIIASMLRGGKGGGGFGGSGGGGFSGGGSFGGGGSSGGW